MKINAVNIYIYIYIQCMYRMTSLICTFSSDMHRGPQTPPLSMNEEGTVASSCEHPRWCRMERASKQRARRKNMQGSYKHHSEWAANPTRKIRSQLECRAELFHKAAKCGSSSPELDSVGSFGTARRFTHPAGKHGFSSTLGSIRR